MEVGCGRILAWELRYSMVDGNRDAKRKWDEVLHELRETIEAKRGEGKMSEIDSGGNAFPRHEISGYGRIGDADHDLWERQKSGMSLREWYAGMALQGLLANPSTILKQADIPELSFEYADSMIRAGKGEK